MRPTLKKQECLSSRKTIAALFEAGKSTSAYPVRVVYSIEKNSSRLPVQVAFSVPKKKYKRAVDRNRLKRLMREAYRQNKESLHTSCEKAGTQCSLMLIYTGKEERPLKEVEDKIIVILLRLVKENEIHF